MKIKEKHLQLWNVALSFNLGEIKESQCMPAIKAFFELESHGRITTKLDAESQHILDSAINGKSLLGWHLKIWGEDLADGLLSETEVEEIIKDYNLCPAHIAALRRKV
jgi:hypothetical protein